MNKHEQAFCTKLQKWLKYNMPCIFGWEAKSIVAGKNYAYKSDKSFAKEMRNLLLAGKQIIHKFSDIARRGTLFDGFKIHNGSGFFFIEFREPRKNRFYVIECSCLNKYLKTYNPKSISENDCIELGDKYILK